MGATPLKQPLEVSKTKIFRKFWIPFKKLSLNAKKLLIMNLSSKSSWIWLHPIKTTTKNNIKSFKLTICISWGNFNRVATMFSCFLTLNSWSVTCTGDNVRGEILILFSLLLFGVPWEWKIHPYFLTCFY